MIISDIEVLRRPVELVQPNEVEELRQLLEQGLAESAAQGRPGIGLACPQIGISKRMAIVRVPVGSEVISLDLVNLFNKNIKGYDLALFNGEGCLSFPDLTKRTQRYQEIYVQGNQGNPANFVATGLVAVAVQHEQDHLDNRLLIDM